MLLLSLKIKRNLIHKMWP